MHDIQELKEMLCGELEEYGKKESLSMDDLRIVDMLAHATKNLMKILDGPGESYSVKRDKKRYTGNNGSGVVDELRQMMQRTEDEQMRRDIEVIIQRYE